ncbi:MAG: hypothetical protein E7411_08145 [Ruminococcaceae bacterium]|nr:hypothetical protein [Oscillospiraceae bacterium]
MKRLLAFIIAISLSLSVAGVISFATSENIVFSETFENGMADCWRTSSSAVGDKFTLTSDDKSEGSDSLRIWDDDTQTSSGIRTGYITAEPKHKYRLYGDIKVNEGNLTLYFRVYNADKKQLSSASSKAKNEWSTAKLDLVAGEDAAYIEVIAMTSAEPTGEGYIDNIKIVDMGIPTEMEMEVASSTTREMKIKTDTKAGENVLFDSFEEPLAGWKNYSSAVEPQFERVSTEKTDGSNSLRIFDDSATLAFGVRSGYIPVKEFNKYQISFDGLAKGTSATVYFRLYDNDKVQVNVRSALVSKDSWGVTTVALESGFNCGYVEAIIQTNNQLTGEVFIDNLKITDMGEGEKDTVSGPMRAAIMEKLDNAKPGDVIEIPNGEYKDVALFIRPSGTADKPITLKAQEDGKVILKGKSEIRILGSYIVVSGVVFKNASSEQLVRFEPESHHSMFTNSAIIDCDHEDITQSQKQVYIRGQYHTVSNIYFRNKSSVGQMIEVPRDTDAPDYHTIESCYFGDFKLGSVNGLETIRIGRSDQSQSSSYTIIRNNFFERCSGENELISLKSSENKVLNNTFYNSQGSMHFRQGHGTLLEGNVFVGPVLSTTSSGITVHDKDHIIRNNYIYAMPSGFESLRLSDYDPRMWLHGYWPVKDVEVSNNTFVDCDYGVQVGYYYVTSDPVTMAIRVNPPEGVFKNNAIISYKGTMPLIENQDSKRVNDTEFGNGLKHNVTFENNYVSGKAVGYEGGTPSGVIEGNFDYEIIDGFVIPKNGSGAALEEIKKAPKNPFEVMPKWVKEQYYDTGIYKFEPLPHDPFNTSYDVASVLPVSGKINVMMNGKRKVFDVDPQIINSRTMVPLRAIFEEFGAEVSWDEATATATAVSNLNTIKITRDSATAYINDATVTLDSPATIVDGRFLVPLRFISEAYGAEVNWVGYSQTATINYTKSKITGWDDTVYKPMHDIKNALTIYRSKFTMEKNSACVFPVMFDGSFGSRWAYQADEAGNPGYCVVDFGEVKTFDKLYLSFLNGEKRSYKFSIYVSEDDISYTPVIVEKSSSGKTNLLEEYSLDGAKGRYIKMVGHGNSAGAAWNDPSEFVVTGK